MRAHSDEEILNKALTQLAQKEDRAVFDLAIDLDDQEGLCHTYAVTLQRSDAGWKCVQIEELSSL